MLILKKRNLSLKQKIFLFLILMSLPFLILAIIFTLLHLNPWKIYSGILQNSLGDFYSFSEVLVKSTPLILTGLSVLIAAKAGLWNIGAEGQLIMGGTCSAICALTVVKYIPIYMHLPIVILAGFIGGLIWAYIPIFLKIKWEISEIISSLLLNYVALIFMEHLYFGPLRDPMGFGFPGTAILPVSTWLPRFFQTRISLNLFIGLGLCFLGYLFFQKTPLGYKIKVCGLNPNAATYAHFPQKKLLLIAFLISGGIAGLAGMGEVLGLHRRLQQGLSMGYGYDGILIAFLAQKNPLLVPILSVLLSIIKVGAEGIQTNLHIPASFTLILEGFMLLSFLGALTLSNYKLKWIKKNE